MPISYLYEFGSMPELIEASVSNVYLHTFLGGQALPDVKDAMQVQDVIDTVVTQTDLPQQEVEKYKKGITQLMNSWSQIAEEISYRS